MAKTSFPYAIVWLDGPGVGRFNVLSKDDKWAASWNINVFKLYLSRRGAEQKAFVICAKHRLVGAMDVFRLDDLANMFVKHSVMIPAQADNLIDYGRRWVNRRRRKSDRRILR